MENTLSYRAKLAGTFDDSEISQNWGLLNRTVSTETENLGVASEPESPEDDWGYMLRRGRRD